MPVFAARAKTLDDESTTVLHQQREEREFQQALAQAKADGQAAALAAMASRLRGVGSGGALQRYDRAADSVRDPWCDLVSGRGQRQSRSRLPLRPPLSDHDSRLAHCVGRGRFSVPFRSDRQLEYRTGRLWPDVRNAQRQALALKNTGMAVTIDIGDPVDIHPKNKQDVGLRFARRARDCLRRKSRVVRPALSPGHARRTCPARVVRSRQRIGGQGRGTYGLRDRGCGWKVLGQPMPRSMVLPSWYRTPLCQRRYPFATDGRPTQTAICSIEKDCPHRRFRHRSESLLIARLCLTAPACN